MSTAPIDFAARPDSGALRPASGLSEQWAALHDAANAVAGLAGLAAEKTAAEVRDFPAVIAESGGWRLDLARSGIADMTAMMTPGVKALLAVSHHGQDPTAPALTLWREFHHARAALLALAAVRTDA